MPSVKHTIMRRGYYVQYEDVEPLFFTLLAT